MKLATYWAVYHGGKWKIYHNYHFDQFKNWSNFPLHGAEDRFEAKVLLRQHIKDGFAGVQWCAA